MDSPAFTHLHLHSTFSRLDGMIDAEELMDYCLEHGMAAVALTDHGTMAGSIQFYRAAQERGIKPILGLETYLVDDHTQKEGPRYHEGLLAADRTGYHNLVHLSTLGFTAGLRLNRYACVDDEQLALLSPGLLCLSGCISSRLARTILGGLRHQEALSDQATELRQFAQDVQSFREARRKARSLAIEAQQLSPKARDAAIAQATARHAFLDRAESVLGEGHIEGLVTELQAQAQSSFEAAWAQAKAIVERRLAVFGDRYYLETQVIPSEDQQRYNAYVRQLGQLYGIPCVVTADAHYLRRSDADLHRVMLGINTSARKEPKERKAKAPVDFPEDQRAAILEAAGESEVLAELFESLALEQMSCTGRKLNTQTKAYAERRDKWVRQAQLYYLQQQGQESDEEPLPLSEIDPGRPFAEWEPEFWVRTPAEMLAAGCLPQEMANTQALAERVDLQLELNTPEHRVVHMPDFELPAQLEHGAPRPADWDANDYLAYLCERGLRRYLDQHLELDPSPYYRQLSYELDVICQAGFATYFLIVRDYVEWVRTSGGLVGPGRGSACGSLCTFLLGITKIIDPLQYPDLMFERFLTPGRPDLPDLDIDFDYDSADRVYQYCKERYGEEAVYKIATFTQLGVRQALQDVGRVIGIPYPDVERAAKILGDFKPDDEETQEDNKAMFSLVAFCSHHEELAGLRAQSALHQQWFAYADALQGIRRNASQHASGVAIGPCSLLDLGVPLQASTNSKGRFVVTTQYGMDDLATLGIPKFDQLKLSNLTIIARAERLIGSDFRIDEVPLQDQRSYAALSKGDNLGIFQMAQPKVRTTMRTVKPRRLNDLAAIITVIRPGLFAKDPQSGLTMEQLYYARRSGRLPVHYAHPFLEPILKDTLGIMIFQEQCLQIMWACGVDKLTADKIRKAMSKKKHSELVKYKVTFVEAAKAAQHLSDGEATELWGFLEEFAGYAFNSAHAYAYGLVGYWTSYLKTHYPAQFMAATLTIQAEKTSKAAKDLLPRLLEDCNQMGRHLPVLPPDVNASEATFRVEVQETKGGLREAIRFGLQGIKNVGATAQAILEARRAGPFSSLEDFDWRVSSTLGKRLNKQAFLSLAYAGALDAFAEHRSAVVHWITVARATTKTAARQLTEQGWLPERAQVLAEKQADLCSGYYFIRDNFEVLGREVDNFFLAGPREKLTIGGRVMEAKLDQHSKGGKPYHRILLKTQWGDVTVDFFAGNHKDPAAFLRSIKTKLFHGSVVIVKGTVKDDRGLWGDSLSLPEEAYRVHAEAAS